MTTSTSASENRPHDLRRKRTPGGMLSWVLAARPPGLDADHVRSVCRGRVSLLGLTRVLITGMSSTGKSTALAELAGGSIGWSTPTYPAWSIELASPDGSGAEQFWRE